MNPRASCSYTFALSNMLDNIPYEMRLLPQWVCAGPDKNPLNPRTGYAASVTEPSTWGTFEEARHAGYMHIGFVLTPADPYSIIDLDAPVSEEQAARHQKILATFDSYSELSQSGLGVHIIVRGKVPSGTRKDKVELYSDGRYMICTGRVLNPLPITDHQGWLEALHGEMASTAVADLDETGDLISDAEVLRMADGAANATKYRALVAGDTTGYPSQSEADFALLSMYAFYSKSNEQVRRLFRMCALGQRDKAQRNNYYLDVALSKIRGRQAANAVPLIDLSALLAAPLPPPPPPAYMAPAPPVVIEVPGLPPPPPKPRVSLPPGLIGEMAGFIHSTSIRPVWEVALAAAIGYGAGLIGRQWNISSTGLNQFLVLLAPTGTGKEGAVGGIDALQASVRGQVPAIDDFVGPGTFASGQALTRIMDKTPCFVSVLGEVGLTLQQICSRDAAPHDKQLRKVLLDVYAKSGWNKWLRPSVYSDSDKNTGLVRAPNVTILGESTPENFYQALDATHISEGLIPRFLVIEYTGPRPPINPRAFHAPDHGLAGRVGKLAQLSLAMRHNDTCCPVQMDRSAHRAMDAFNCYADDCINKDGADEVTKQLWNRAHLKALKLAGLVAVGCNLDQPIVTGDIAEWAINLVRQDIDNMVSKFSSGVVGLGDHQQEADLRAAIDRYPQFTEEQRASYKVPKLLLNRPQLVPYVFLKRYCVMRSAFKNDRRGAVLALQTALGDMLKSGMLAQIPSEQAKKELGVDSPVYYRGEAY